VDVAVEDVPAVVARPVAVVLLDLIGEDPIELELRIGTSAEDRFVQGRLGIGVEGRADRHVVLLR